MVMTEASLDELGPVDYLVAGPRAVPGRGRHYRVCDAPPAASPARTCCQHGTVTEVG